MKAAPFVELLSDVKPVCKSLIKKELLFRQGDDATHIYAVKDGCIKLGRYTIEGCSINMHTAYKGDSFAEAALFSEIYHCNAEAILSSTVLCYPKDQVLETLHMNAKKAIEYIAFLTHQVRSMRTLLELRSIRSAHQRIHQFLLLQANPQNLEVQIKETYMDMAQELGMAHETFYRGLAKLEKEGKIQRTPSAIKIIKSSFI